MTWAGGPWIVDTSAWARASHPQIAERWKAAADAGELVGHPVVTLELLYDARDRSSVELVARALAGLRQAPLDRGVSYQTPRSGRFASWRHPARPAPIEFECPTRSSPPQQPRVHFPMASRHPRLQVARDPELAAAIERGRSLVGPREPAPQVVRALALRGAAALDEDREAAERAPVPARRCRRASRPRPEALETVRDRAWA